MIGTSRIFRTFCVPRRLPNRYDGSDPRSSQHREPLDARGFCTPRQPAEYVKDRLLFRGIRRSRLAGGTPY